MNAESRPNRSLGSEAKRTQPIYLDHFDGRIILDDLELQTEQVVKHFGSNPIRWSANKNSNSLSQNFWRSALLVLLKRAARSFSALQHFSF